MKLKIELVSTKKQTKQFINFPHTLYKGDKNYVPELYLSISEVLSAKKNPFFNHSEADLFLAIDQNDNIVGRVAAILNNNYNEHHDCNVGFFGFFDVIENYEVAKQLLDNVSSWLRDKKVNQVLGPTNFTTNDTAGVLVDGYDSPPVVMMTYNYPYYDVFLKKYGFEKEMDLFAYWIDKVSVNEKSLRIAKMLESRLEGRSITIRNTSNKTKKSDIIKIKDVYREAWEKNWGFVPPTDEEFDHLAEGLNLLIDNNYVYIAEDNKEVIGFGVAVPDINEITKDFKKGKLLPFNIFKLLAKKSKVGAIRIILLGVKERYRKMGIEAIFFAKYIEAARNSKTLKGGEASWILESNEMMVKAAENLNGKRYKTYRIYSKPLKH